MNTRILLMSTALVAALATTPAVAYMTEKEVAAAAEMGPETRFVTKAAMGGLFEVEASKLALQKSTNPEVLAFAERMIKDHTAANAQLKAIARRHGNGEIVARKLDKKHQEKLAKLSASDDFDDDYLDMQEDAHEKAIDLFEDYAAMGENPELKAFAQKTLPKLRAHEDHIDKID